MSCERQVLCADCKQFLTTEEFLISLLNPNFLTAMDLVGVLQHNIKAKAKLLICGLSLINCNFLMR